MTKTALLLPGQAEIEGEKALTIIEGVKRSERYLRAVEQITGLDIRKIVSDEADLNQIINAQLTQFVCSATLAETILRSPIRFEPDFLIGHSMGEYTAFYLAGAFDLETTIALLVKRADLIKSVPNGSMALVRSDPETLKEMLLSYPEVTIGAINGPRDLTITGLRLEVEKVVQRLTETGVICRVLDSIGVMSHSPLLAKQAQALVAVLKKATINNLKLPVMATNKVEIFGSTKRKDIENYLMEQLATPVRWLESVQFLWEQGVRFFVECGASPFLGRLVKKIYPEAEVTVISGTDNLEKIHQFNKKVAKPVVK